MKTTQHKAIVGLIIASVGSAITAALAFTTAGDPWNVGLTIAAAAITPLATYLGVFWTSNKEV